MLGDHLRRHHHQSALWVLLLIDREETALAFYLSQKSQEYHLQHGQKMTLSVLGVDITKVRAAGGLNGFCEEFAQIERSLLKS